MASLYLLSNLSSSQRIMQPQASLAGFCWPAGAAAPATPTSPMVPGSSPNPAAMAMALAAIRGGTAASLYAAAAAGSPAMPTGYPPPADPSGLTASLMAAGFYSLPTGAVSPIPASLYNPVEVSAFSLSPPPPRLVSPYHNVSLFVLSTLPNFNFLMTSSSFSYIDYLVSRVGY